MSYKKSGIDQPTNDSVIGRTARLPGISKIPVFGVDSPLRSQELIDYDRPLQNQNALLKDDGSVVTAIRVQPANLSTADPDEWENRVDRLSSILGSAVSGKIQWYNPVRSVNYEDRRETYDEAARSFESATDVDAMADVLADLSEERAAVVHQYEDTTTVREYYVLVEVDPDDTMFGRMDGAGFSNLYGIKNVMLWWKMRDIDDDDPERLATALNTLFSRAKKLSNSLGSIEGINSYRVSSAEFSKVVSNYYTSDDVYSISNFKDLVRQSPILSDTDVMTAGESAQELEYTHITNIERDDDTDGETGYGGKDDVDIGDTQKKANDLTDDIAAPPSTTEMERNAGIDTGLAADEEELSEMFKSILAPEEFDRSDAQKILLDGDQYVQTLRIRDWPKNPQHGLLESILNYSAPGVETFVTTHLHGNDDEKAQRDLSAYIDICDDKLEKYRKSDYDWLYPRWLVDKRKQDKTEAEDILSTLRNTKYGMFDSNTYIQARSPDPNKLQEAVDSIESCLADVGARAKVMSYNQETGFRSVAPVVDDKGGEPTKMLGDGVASLFSWSSHNLWEKGGVSMGLHRDRSEPTVFDLWARDAGFSIGVFGIVGSGKTTTTKRLLLRYKLLEDWQSMARSSRGSFDDSTLMVCIDPLQEFAGLCQLFGGERVVIGGDTNINPLYYEEVSDEKREIIGGDTARIDAERRAMSFIESFYEQHETSLGDSGKRGVWEKALSISFDNGGSGMESPTLGHTLDIIRDIIENADAYVDERIEEESARKETAEDLKKTAIEIINNDVEAFKEGGNFENLTKQTDIDLSNEQFVYLDLQRYEQEQNTAALLMQLLMDQVYEQAKSRDGKTILSMDEAHYLLNNTANMESLKQITLHHRHHDLSLIFSTQAMGEFFSSSGGLTSAGEVIFDNLATRIYHFNNEIDDEWADELELTNAEHDFIQNARTGSSGCAEALLQIKQEGTYPIQVDMGDNMNPREFAITEYDPTDHGESLRDYIRDYGDGVCQWRWTQ